ncbi:hypothetical protein ACWELP_00745 [Rhodococcus aetherivorans]
MTVGTVDASDMYRGALVQGVAALDSYVHDVVLDYAVAIVLGTRAAGSVSRLGLHFGAVSDLVTAPSAVDREMRAREAINERLSTETFQKPDDIGKAFAMVGVNKLWASVFGPTAGDVTTALRLVVARRNGIVHRCDVDPSGFGAVLSLSDTDALEAISTVERVVHGINGHI